MTLDTLNGQADENVNSSFVVTGCADQSFRAVHPLGALDGHRQDAFLHRDVL